MRGLLHRFSNGFHKSVISGGSLGVAKGEVFSTVS